MGVSFRLTRNTRAYVPFWLAVPVWLAWAAVAGAVLVVWLLVMVLAVWPARLLRRKAARDAEALQ